MTEDSPLMISKQVNEYASLVDGGSTYNMIVSVVASPLLALKQMCLMNKFVYLHD